MDTNTPSRKQALAGIERLAALLRTRSWGNDDGPALHPAHRAALLALAAHPQGLRGNVLAECLGVSAASLSDTLRTLEQRGWLRRDVDPDDGRAHRNRLTRSGGALARRLQSPDSGLAPLLRALPERELGQLQRVLQLLMREAQQQGLASGLRTCLGCEFFHPFAHDDPRRPHHCGYVDAAFGDVELRIDCAEHSPRTEATPDPVASRFLAAAEVSGR